MSRRSQRFVLAVGLALLGCQPAADRASAHTPAFTAQLAAELARAGELLRLPALLLYAFTLLLTLSFIWLTRTAVVTLWRLGFDSSRSLARAILIVKLTAALTLPIWFLLRIASVAPTLVVILTPALVAALGLIFARQLQNVGGGVALTLSRRIREGDRIEVGSHQGIVREVGLTRIKLRRDDGSSAYIPNRFVLGEVVAVSRERNTAPVDVQLVIDSTASPEQVYTRARQLGALCPYRVTGTQVHVQFEVLERRLSLTVQTWAEPAVVPCRTHLLRSLSAAFSRSLGAPETEAVAQNTS